MIYRTMNRYAPLMYGMLAMPVTLLLLAVLAHADQGCQEQESWIFRRSRYSHDIESGVRVAQYARGPVVEALPDPRAITSGYNRSRSILRGANGSADTYYRVQSYGNGQGGLDAEWERFHDAWRGSTIAGGRYQTNYGPFRGFGGYGQGGYGPGGYGPGGYPTPYSAPGGPGVSNPRPGYYPGNGHPGYGAYPGNGYGTPDYQRLDPDGANGYPTRNRNRSDAEFFGRPPKQGQAPGGGGGQPGNGQKP
jgi:hypothetical protein